MKKSIILAILIFLVTVIWLISGQLDNVNAVDGELSISSENLKIEPITKVGKRGKDKAKRKQKVMSQAQLDALARGRAKSLAKRKEKSAAKKQPVKQVIKEMKPKKSKPVNIPVMPKPTPHTKLDYDTFSSYMTQYDEARKKKQSQLHHILGKK